MEDIINYYPPQPLLVETEDQSAVCPSQEIDTLKKCMQPGRVTNNGYLNFLREFRQKNCNLSAVEVVKEGAKCWNALSCAEKLRYQKMGEGCHVKKRRPRSKRRMSRCRSRSKSTMRSRSSCACRSVSRGRSRSRSRRNRSRCGSKRRRSRSRSRSRSCSRSRRYRSPRRKRYPSKRRSVSRRRRSSSCRSRRPRIRCTKPGPIMSNPYLNFLRSFRRRNCGLTTKEVVRRGARKWCSLTPAQKKRYMRMACRVARSNYSRRKAICREVRRNRRKCS